MLDEESSALAHHLPADNENDCVLASATAMGCRLVVSLGKCFKH
jgi:hypothetical protein